MSSEIEKAREWLRQNGYVLGWCGWYHNETNCAFDAPKVLAAYHASRTAERPTAEAPAPARTNPCPKCGSTLIHKDCRHHERRQGPKERRVDAEGAIQHWRSHRISRRKNGIRSDRRTADRRLARAAEERKGMAQ